MSTLVKATADLQVLPTSPHPSAVSSTCHICLDFNWLLTLHSRAVLALSLSFARDIFPRSHLVARVGTCFVRATFLSEAICWPAIELGSYRRRFCQKPPGGHFLNQVFAAPPGGKILNHDRKVHSSQFRPGLPAFARAFISR